MDFAERLFRPRGWPLVVWGASGVVGAITFGIDLARNDTHWAIGLVVGTFLGVFGGLTIAALLFLVVLILALVLLLGFGVLALFEVLVHHLVDARWPRARRIALLPVPPAPACGDWLRGRVKTETTIVAPLSGTACAAFRLLGTSAHGAIDDAGLTSFTIEGETEDAVIDGDASVDVPVAGEATTFGDVPFLHTRLPASKRSLRAREGLVIAGDEVEISGPYEREIRTEGYRDARTVRRYRERDGQPVVLRRGR